MMTGFKTVLAATSGLVVGGFGGMAEAIAAESIILDYGIFSMDIPVEDLETLAETGEASDELARLLKQVGQEPETLQATLNQSIEVSPVVLDTALNSFPGEWVLEQISETIQPASGLEGRRALRGALIGAAADDNKITLLELMQGYPSPEVKVDGERLLAFYSQLATVVEPLMDIAKILEVLQD